MGQKVNPTGLRVGIIKSWDSLWYDEKKTYAQYLHEDLQIQDFIQKKHKNAGIAKVTIERLYDRLNVNINAARPGLLIGRKGVDIEVLKSDLQKIASKTVYINIIEVKKPEKVSNAIPDQSAPCV